MSQARQHETDPRSVSSLAGRVAELERRLRDLEAQPPPHPAIFSMPTESALTTAYPCIDGGVITRAVAQLSTAGSTTTTGEIRRNGSALISFAILAGTKRAEIGSGYALNESDELTGIVTAYGTGAAGCTVYCMVSPNS